MRAVTLALALRAGSMSEGALVLTTSVTTASYKVYSIKYKDDVCNDRLAHVET